MITPAFGANKPPQIQGVTLTPAIYISNSSEDTRALNVNVTPIISKSANLLCIPNIKENLKKHEKEQTITKTENLHAEMIALRSFAVEQIYMVKKRSKIKVTSFCLKRTVLDEIEFLKQELKSKAVIIKTILQNYKQNTDYRCQTVKETVKQNNHSDKGEREF